MIERSLSKPIREALGVFPVVYVAGPRQAGKSTLALWLAANEWPAGYVTFDEATLLGAAEANPESFLRAYDGRLVLDEVQMAPSLFRALKILVDEARFVRGSAANGRYLLTGSSSILALPRLADALVGRMSVLTLYPLSALEISAGSGNFLPTLLANRFKPEALPGALTLAEMIASATFPEISNRDAGFRRQWFESYITTILQRDVRQIADIAKLGVLPNLLRVLAGRAGGLVNEADIARTIGQNAVTTRNYRTLLRMMFLTMDVKPWYRNVGKRLVKAPKSYLVDTSLLCHLQRIDIAQSEVAEPHVFGPVLENFVATELAKQLAVSGGVAELFHFRTSDGKEVDFVLECPDGRLAAIEVKGRDVVTEHDFRGLKELRRHVGKDFVCGAVLYRGSHIVPFGDDLWAVPVAGMWSR